MSKNYMSTRQRPTIQGLFLLLCLALAQVSASGQCSFVGIQISSSDTSLVQLYQAGFFLIPSGAANVCAWEVRSFSGEIVHQATTSGVWEDQSFSLFSHSVPLSDSMKATLVITNAEIGITCSISDTIYWKETEVLPGAFIGSWTILSQNGGQEADITSATTSPFAIEAIELFPSPGSSYVEIRSELPAYSFAIFDLSGRCVARHDQPQARVDTGHLSSGMYLIRFWDQAGRPIGTKKWVKS